MIEEQVDWVALSFVRTAEEVLELKSLIRELSALSRPTPMTPALRAGASVDAIIRAADAITPGKPQGHGVEGV